MYLVLAGFFAIRRTEFHSRTVARYSAGYHCKCHSKEQALAVKTQVNARRWSVLLRVKWDKKGQVSLGALVSYSNDLQFATRKDGSPSMFSCSSSRDEAQCDTTQSVVKLRAASPLL